MSRRTWWVYLVGLIVIVGTPALARPGRVWPLFVLLTVLATVSHLLEARGPNREAWSANVAFYFAGLLLLSPFLFALLVTIPHVVQWVVERVENGPGASRWYVQPYNVGMHLLAGFAARWAISAVSSGAGSGVTAPAVLVTLAGVVVYVAVNHLLVTAALTARGIAWRQSGILDFENLLTDAAMLCTGYILAVLWTISPWLILPALCPLIVNYRVLTIPQLKKAAQTDARTGLFNAGYLEDAFSSEFERAQRSGQPLSIIMADLDLMRNVNNTYGHLAGNAVLTGVSRIIHKVVGDHGIVGRFGGEEFSVILPRLNEHEAEGLAERIRKTIADTEFRAETSPDPIRVTMSLGVAARDASMATSNDLIHDADMAVYQAKLSGRNRVVRASLLRRPAESQGAGPGTSDGEKCDVSLAPRLHAAGPDAALRARPLLPARGRRMPGPTGL